MSIEVVSATDSAEQVKAVNEANNPKVEETKQPKSASTEETHEDETPKESETLENETEETDGESESTDQTDDPEAEKSDDQPKKKNGFKKRIDKLNQRISVEAQEKEYWKQKALEKETPRQETQPKEEPKKADTEGRPKVDDYKTLSEYEDALVDYKIEQKEKAKEAAKRVEQIRTAQQEEAASFQKRIQAFSDKTEDFKEVIESVKHVKATPTLQQILISSEMGPEVIYELAKNTKEFERINALSPLAAAKEIGKIEARLAKSSDSTQTNEKKISKAPPPVTPVKAGGNGSPKKTIYSEGLSLKEYEALRSKK